jgi:hypothetical protein
MHLFPRNFSIMNLSAKLSLLESMINIYDRFVGEFDLACQKFCAHCCTANVTMTTLEGYRIFSHLEKTGATHYLETIAQQSHPNRYRPLVSINRLADICARDGDPPEENLSAGRWPLPGFGG